MYTVRAVSETLHDCLPKDPSPPVTQQASMGAQPKKVYKQKKTARSMPPPITIISMSTAMLQHPTPLRAAAQGIVFSEVVVSLKLLVLVLVLEVKLRLLFF